MTTQNFMDINYNHLFIQFKKKEIFELIFWPLLLKIEVFFTKKQQLLFDLKKVKNVKTFYFKIILLNKFSLNKYFNSKKKIRFPKAVIKKVLQIDFYAAT